MLISCANNQTSEENPAVKAEHPGKKAEHPGKKAEHPGKKAEHPGKKTEHPGGKPHHKKGECKKDKNGKCEGSEHGGKEHGGNATSGYSADSIKMAMIHHIDASQKKGIFKIRDHKSNNKMLNLKFVKIHNPVRKVEGKGYFACTDFAVAGDKEGKLYDLDFWLNPKDNVLHITETKIHKHPQKLANGKWKKKARYTFINDRPVEIQ